ncbi:MAG: hypothetical protein H5T34_04050 [Candidatus Methanomethyliales bacterium]|nr:hypothetical protein [Candidatus Methanomethylicales archaeon]
MGWGRRKCEPPEPADVAEGAKPQANAGASRMVCSQQGRPFRGWTRAHMDLSGRNLKAKYWHMEHNNIPPYRFKSDSLGVMGQDAGTGAPECWGAVCNNPSFFVGDQI